MKVKILIGILIVLVVGGIGLLVYKNGKANEGYDLKIYFFEAGKADCILISNNGEYIMIDTGEETLSGTILQYLKNNNITKLDYLIITHFDKDHVGSAAAILNNVTVDNVLQSNCPKDSKYYENYINALNGNGITPTTVSSDMTFALADLKITVNGPKSIYDSNESNNSSLIVEMNYKDTNYLFTGDAQNDRIKDYLKTKSSAASYDFIKIPYHGNYQKQLDNLLEWANPTYAVITCSDEEPDTSETEDLLQEMNIEYYLTKNGSVTITSDGINIKIKQ